MGLRRRTLAWALASPCISRVWGVWVCVVVVVVVMGYLQERRCWAKEEARWLANNLWVPLEGEAGASIPGGWGRGMGVDGQGGGWRMPRMPEPSLASRRSEAVL